MSYLSWLRIAIVLLSVKTEDYSVHLCASLYMFSLSSLSSPGTFLSIQECALCLRVIVDLLLSLLRIGESMSSLSSLSSLFHLWHLCHHVIVDFFVVLVKRRWIYIFPVIIAITFDIFFIGLLRCLGYTLVTLYLSSLSSLSTSLFHLWCLCHHVIVDLLVVLVKHWWI